MPKFEYFILDIETCPIDVENYEQQDEEDRKKLLNPIDSEIVAIGIRYDGKNTIIMKNEDDSDEKGDYGNNAAESNEKQMLIEFWNEWKKLHEKNINIKTVGFNITNFDIPFLVVRSFIHNVAISPFTIKFIIDLRDKVNAYRHGHSRGTLKDFGKVLGFPADMDGFEVAGLCKKKGLGNPQEIPGF